MFPNTLIQHIHGEYIKKNYSEGVYVFQSLSTKVIELIVKSFIAWAEMNGYVKEGMLDLSFLKGK